MMIRIFKYLLTLALLGACVRSGRAQGGDTNQPPLWQPRPLSLTDALNLALQQNGAILRGRNDLEAQYGVVVQTRAIVLPHLQANGNYEYSGETQAFPFPGSPPADLQNWQANVQLVQTIYQGGQLKAAVKTASLTKDVAELNFRTVIADSLLLVRIAYYDVLSTAEQVTVEESSVKLLTQELDDQTRRFEAGTVPRFNVLRAEVELANERPRLIQARNDYRIAKNNLVDLLGYRVLPGVQEDVPLDLTDKLEAEPYKVDLTAAISRALTNRTEIQALRKQQALADQGVITAKGNYLPAVSVFGGYGTRNTEFNNDLVWVVKGPSAGAQFTWNIFDGLLTQGKVKQARAVQGGAQVDLDNRMRTVELEVRTDYSNFLEATEVLESQKKVVEEAEEALRLASARSDAGTGTQLDVLSAQNSLTQARSVQVQALRGYDVARVRLARAIGDSIIETTGK